MAGRRFEVGDLVFSRMDIYNDGGTPDVEQGAILAPAGTRGIIVRVPAKQTRFKEMVYVVRFERADQLLGSAVACLEEELTQDPAECYGATKRTP
jgi:nitrogen fixation protein NifZ